MKAPDYKALTRSQSVRNTLRALGTLTGLTIKLAPIEPQPKDRLFASRANPLCQLMARAGNGHAVCEKCLAKLQSQLERRPSLRVVRCFAGLTEMAVPVVVNGSQVATLLGGGFLPGNRSERGFARWLRQTRQGGLSIARAIARSAYYQTTVIPSARIRAAGQLLVALAEHLGEVASRCLVAQHHEDPACVACAKRFAQEHLTEAVKTRDVAQAAHLTESHFCRRFKAATDMTFAEYLARCRVEQAKALLARPALRVSDVALASGFQSIPHFNHTFKRYIGLNPTAWRASLRQ
jgi:AraC-like DNA-binding protein/ligand-binding sensor protein